MTVYSISQNASSDTFADLPGRERQYRGYRASSDIIRQKVGKTWERHRWVSEETKSQFGGRCGEEASVKMAADRVADPR